MFDFFRKKESQKSTDMSTANLLSCVPVQAYEEIFGYLSLEDLLSAAKVCKLWNQVIKKSTDNKPCFFEKIDEQRAKPWIDKIQQELTESPPVYLKNKTVNYFDFYTKMQTIKSSFFDKKLADFLPGNDALVCNYFSGAAISYIDNGLDVKLRKLCEAIQNVSIYLTALLDTDFTQKLFGANSTACLKVIAAYLSKDQLSVLLHKAVDVRHQSYIEELLKYEINFSMRDLSNGKTALTLAFERDEINILKMLCDKLSTQVKFSMKSQYPREKFYNHFAIPYQVYLNTISQSKKHDETSVGMNEKMDLVIEHLSNEKDPDLINLFYDIILNKNADLVEKLNLTVEEQQSFNGPYVGAKVQL